jgi:hypothetical protein
LYAAELLRLGTARNPGRSWEERIALYSFGTKVGQKRGR